MNPYTVVALCIIACLAVAVIPYIIGRRALARTRTGVGYGTEEDAAEFYRSAGYSASHERKARTVGVAAALGMSYGSKPKHPHDKR